MSVAFDCFLPALGGFAVGGLGPYTRTVGQVFSPDVSLIFILKTLFLSLAIGIIPMAWAWSGPRADAFELFDVVEADQAVRLEHSVPQASQQIGPARENAGLGPGRRLGRLLNRNCSLI